MSEAAVQTATLLQQKVGNSLSGVTNLLAPPERSDSLLNAGAASLPALVLDEVKELQKKTIESVDKVAQVLQSQLDLAQEAERRARDQAAELRKENKLSGVAPAGNLNVTGADEGMFGLTPDKLKDLLTFGLGSIFTVSALKTAFKKLGGRLLRGGAIASLVSLLADPVINYIDDEFELELTDQTKKDIKLSLVGAGIGSMFGIPGAIIGGTLPYISRVAQYIAGELDASQVKDSDFAMTALGGSLAAYFTAGKVGALLKLSTIPRVATFGAALASVPVMLAIGAAVALGVGVSFMAKKMDEYQERMLDTLAERMVELDKEMGEFAAKQSEGLFEKMGIQMGNLSALGQARVASEEALEQFGQNEKKFLADEEQQGTLKALANTIASYNDEAIKTILDDSTKSTSLFTTIESLKSIAAQGGFGKDSKEIFGKMMAFSDNIQRVAKEQVEAGTASHTAVRVADNRLALSGDQLESAGIIQKRISDTEQKILDTKAKIVEEEKKLQEMKDAGMGPDRNPFNTNEFEAQEELIKDLKDDISGQFGFLKDIELDLKKLEKFGSTNGFLFNMEDLKQLYADDPDGLKTLIERSVNQQGSNFLQAQSEANKNEEKSNNNVVVQDNSAKTQNNNVQKYNYVGKLNVNGDPYFVREGYSYGL